MSEYSIDKKEAFDGSRNEAISEAIKKFDAILEKCDFLQ
jgi:hypothetical protein